MRAITLYHNSTKISFLLTSPLNQNDYDQETILSDSALLRSDR